MTDSGLDVRVLAVLRALEWSKLTVAGQTCPTCWGRLSADGHVASCRLARVIGELEARIEEARRAGGQDGEGVA